LKDRKMNHHSERGIHVTLASLSLLKRFTYAWNRDDEALNRRFYESESQGIFYFRCYILVIYYFNRIIASKYFYFNIQKKFENAKI